MLNKGQQARAALMTGLSRSGLRDALGFTGGPTSFAGGGEISKSLAKRITRIQKPIAAGIDDDLLESVADALKDVEAVMKGVAKLGKITRRVRPVVDLIELATKEGGLLDGSADGD